MEFQYLVRRARWLERRLSQTNADQNPGYIFDLNEYNELRKAFPRLGVKYVSAEQKPVERNESVGRRAASAAEPLEQPPMICEVGEVFRPGEGRTKGARDYKDRAPIVDERRFPGRFIPGGL